MKQSFFRFLMLIMIILIANSCVQKIDENTTQFTIPYNTQIVVPATIDVNVPLIIPTPNILTKSDSTFNSKNTNDNLIQSIYLDKMSLYLIFPGDSSLNFVKSIDISIDALGLDEQLVAYSHNVQDSTKTLNLDLSRIDLQNYLKKDFFSFNVKTQAQKLIVQNYIINILCVFKVNATTN